MLADHLLAVLLLAVIACCLVWGVAFCLERSQLRYVDLFVPDFPAEAYGKALAATLAVGCTLTQQTQPDGLIQATGPGSRGARVTVTITPHPYGSRVVVHAEGFAAQQQIAGGTLLVDAWATAYTHHFASQVTP
jgi:hypothetical protein